MGCLSSANIPNITGLDTFKGRWYHTGEWPHEGVDFKGKRVGLIGTGSTGIQAAPVIAETAAHLTVFQRTANYSVPARNAPLTPEFKRYVKENAAEIRQVMHSTVNGHPFTIADRSALETPPEERQAIYEAAWEIGSLRFRATFRDLLTDKAANDTAADFIRAKIREIVKDPATAAKLSDFDHPYAAKRPPIDTDYFETFNRDNVELVDVRAAPIEQITPRGIRTRDAEYPLDIIVFATGFDGMTGSLLRMDIRGRDGLSAGEGVDGGAAQLSRSAGCRLSEPVYRDGARQPVGTVQHAGRDRAACRVDHRLHRAYAHSWPEAHRADERSGGFVGGAR